MRSSRILLIILLTSAPLLDCRAQWQPVTGAPGYDIYGVQCPDADQVNCAAAGRLVRSVNSGGSWTSQGIVYSGFPFPLTQYDAHFIDPQTGFVTGQPSGQQYIIFRTLNAGGSWSAVYANSAGGRVRFLTDIEFGPGNEGFAVGSGNRLVRTTDGGSNWTQITPPGSGHLYAFRFGSGQVRHMVGTGRILRSTNGGTDWTQTDLPSYDLRGLHFPTATRGYAVGHQGAFLRTDNGGITWDPMPWPVAGMDLRDVHFNSADEGYVVGGNRIWHTTSGGQFWEWFECGAAMRGIDFNESTGYAVGDDGKIFRTNNEVGAYHPIATFSVAPSVLCEDSVITASSSSDPALETTWFLNDTFQAIGSSASFNVAGTGSGNSIQLVVDNGFETDTMTLPIVIAPSLTISVTATAVADTICQGGSTQVQVPGSVSGASYGLRLGNTPIGNAQNGNGGQLTFSTGNLSLPDTLNILMTRVVPGCGTGKDSTYFVIHNGSPDTGLSISAMPTAICVGQSSEILVNGSENGVSYQLMQGTTAVGIPVTGNGGTLTFGTGPILTTTNYTVKASNPHGCISTMLQSGTVVVEEPAAHFTMDSWNPQAGESIAAYNSSSGNVSQLWDFGSGAVPQTSSEEAPQVAFNTLGSRTVTLTVTSPVGCTATTVLPINVINTIAEDDCYTVRGFQLQGGSANLLAVTYAPSGDVFMLTDNGNTLDFQLHSGNLDTIAALGLFLSSEYDYTHHLTKFSSQGVPQWMVRLRFGSPWPKQGDAVIDEMGNSYMAFYHGDHHDSVYVYSADGRYVRFMPPWDGSAESVVIVSWDPQGQYRWHHTYLDYYTINDLNMILDGLGGLYVSSTLNFVKLDAATGLQAWQIPFATSEPFVDVAVDANGEPWLIKMEELVLEHYDALGNLLSRDQYAEELPSSEVQNSRILSQAIEVGADGDLYISAQFHGNIRIGSDTLSDNTWSQGNETDLCIIRLDPQTGPVWTRQVVCEGTGSLSHTGFAVAGEHVIMHGRAGFVTCLAAGHPPMSTGSHTQVLIHFDTDGNTPRMMHFPSPTASGSSYINIYGGAHLLAADPTGTRIASAATFESATMFGTEALVPHPSQYAADLMLGIGDIDCFLSTLPSTTATPVSWFSTTEVGCAGQTSQFQDASLNDATGWSWQFPGGTPSTSTQASPLVTYALPGNHVVTLVSSNANGIGVPFSTSISIDVCTGIEPGPQPLLGLYPSIATDEVTITSAQPTSVPFRILDSSGRVVSTGTLGPTTVVDVQHLANGIYLLTAERNGSVRFVKE